MDPESPRGAWLGPFLGAALFFCLFRAVGSSFLRGYALDLGSPTIPAPLYAEFALMWCVLGGIAIGLLAVALARFVSAAGRERRIAEIWAHIPDETWMKAATVAALAIPIVINRELLRGAPLTDDDSAYRFMSELLASGRLTAPSHPLKLFFDRVFMVNDGRMYSQYFLGWPALAVPGIWLGTPWLPNAVFSAATVPPLFFVLRRLCGSPWAKAGILLFVGSPMLMVGGATGLSHPSCLMALTWTAWFALRSQDEDAPAWAFAGTAFCFELAFFIRPTSTLGIAVPLLVPWLGSFARLPRGRRGRAVLAAAIPVLVMASLFHAANQELTGSFLTTPYQRELAYAKENEYRFSNWSPGNEPAVPHLALERPLGQAAAHLAVGFVRLSFDLFGWPFALALAVFAGRQRKAVRYWLSLGLVHLVHLYVLDPGVDTFGPPHLYEAALPIIVLSTLGLRAAHERFASILPITAFAALVLGGLTGFAPVRLGAISAIAENVNRPRLAAARQKLHKAVVFAARPFAPPCPATGTPRHFVFWRPNNDPDLRNDVLWVNHLDVAQDRRLMEHFPDRRGYVQQNTPDCRVLFLPLDTLEPGQIPDGIIGGSGRGLD